MMIDQLVTERRFIAIIGEEARSVATILISGAGPASAFSKRAARALVLLRLH